MIIIGIAEANDETIVIEMLSEIFKRSGRKLNVVKDSSFQNFIISNSLIKDYIDGVEKTKTDIIVIKIFSNMARQGLYTDIDFNILLYTDVFDNSYNDKFRSQVNQLKNLFLKAKREDVGLISADDKVVLQLLIGSQMQVITYGLDCKATITASSIVQNSDKSTFIYCLQRNISTISKKNIEPQEFPIRVNSRRDNIIYAVLPAATIALICDIDKKYIEEILL